jgi:hypothetical protein
MPHDYAPFYDLNLAPLCGMTHLIFKVKARLPEDESLRLVQNSGPPSGICFPDSGAAIPSRLLAVQAIRKKPICMPEKKSSAK